MSILQANANKKYIILWKNVIKRTDFLNKIYNSEKLPIVERNFIETKIKINFKS